jgi:TolA-binding protein
MWMKRTMAAAPGPGRRLAPGVALILVTVLAAASCGSSSRAAAPATTTTTTSHRTVSGSSASEYRRLVQAEQTFGSGINQVEAALQGLNGEADVTQAQLDQVVAPLATTLAQTQEILRGPWPGRAGPDEKRLSDDLTALGRVAAAATVGQGIASEDAQVESAYTSVETDDRKLRSDLGLPPPSPAG